MTGPVSRLAVYGSKRQQPYLTYISEFVAEVRSRGIALDMHAKLYDYLLGLAPALLEGVHRVPFGEVPAADAGVSLGGDGTFLRTAQWLGPQRIPLVGVNTGHLGFLSALAVEELPDLPAMLAGEPLRLSTAACCKWRGRSCRLPWAVLPSTRWRSKRRSRRR